MIAVVGSSNVDVVLKVDHFTKPGETQKALELSFFPGGKGANQAVTVAKLGEKGCYFVTCVGNDEYGRLLIENFTLYKITGFSLIDKPTGRAFIEVTKEGENRIIIFQGANSYLTKDKIDWEMLSRSQIVLLQNEIPFETTLEVAEKFSGLVIFDPAPAQEIRKEIMQHVDFITPNEEEMKMLSMDLFGEFSTLEESAKKMLNMGTKNVIIKLGEKGVLLINQKRTYHIPAFKVKALDTTAAGDVFNGAFAVAISEGKDTESAIKFANAAAAISVTRYGAQTSIPKREEVENLLNEVKT
ncbi:ribokinase [Thermotoga sp. KOL6]|uniref:ribokinase n=1 Tax=Thermotoga sp. KOL6 TaxID=126741 RepID=UPI000C788BEA|nr:ribokinase [Thermotoga sp. KOL6]PLV58294.1 ribokinase [Thermotoga sp. KOL6]